MVNHLAPLIKQETIRKQQLLLETLWINNKLQFNYPNYNLFLLALLGYVASAGVCIRRASVGACDVAHSPCRAYVAYLFSRHLIKMMVHCVSMLLFPSPMPARLRRCRRRKISLFEMSLSINVYIVLLFFLRRQLLPSSRNTILHGLLLHYIKRSVPNPYMGSVNPVPAVRLFSFWKSLQHFSVSLVIWYVLASHNIINGGAHVRSPRSNSQTYTEEFSVGFGFGSPARIVSAQSLNLLCTHLNMAVEREGVRARHSRFSVHAQRDPGSTPVPPLAQMYHFTPKAIPLKLIRENGTEKRNNVDENNLDDFPS